VITAATFYFLRHGETDWNREGRYQGHSDVPLNATGLAQAQAAAERLATTKIDRIVSSPLIRALKTAAIVAENLGVPIHPDRRLVERDFGSFNGLVIREVKARHGLRLDQSSRHIMPADAEPWEAINARVPPAVAEWLARHPGESLLFVAHGGVFDALHQNVIGPRQAPESKHATPYRLEPAGPHWQIREMV
jgi:broad specificity phosphatase PhoE